MKGQRAILSVISKSHLYGLAEMSFAWNLKLTSCCDATPTRIESQSKSGLTPSILGRVREYAYKSTRWKTGTLVTFGR